MTIYELSRDQFDELKSNFFWGEDTPEELKRDILGRSALFPGDISDKIICEYYAGVYFVNDDFCSPPGAAWVDSARWFCVVTRKPGTAGFRKWCTGSEIKQYRNDGYIVTGFSREIPF